MKISTSGRHLREGLKNIARNGWMSFASVSSVAITLLILGVFLSVALNAQQMRQFVTDQLQISVYLNTNVTSLQGHQIERKISGIPGVKSVQYVTKEQGLQHMQQVLGTQQVVLSNIGPNPLPDEIVVKAGNPQQTAAVTAQIKTLTGIDKVSDGLSIVNKLYHVLDLVRNIGLIFVGTLILTAMFLISNTIKVTIFSRRREIEIMKLVGATNWFIRWPFLVEGIVIGCIGALLPYAVIVVGYSYLFQATGGIFQGLNFPLVASFAIAWKLSVVMFGLGVLIGIWGGIMSIRKFLRV